MRLSVAQKTTFKFETAQRVVMQSRRLTPADFKGQTVLDWRIETEGATVGARFQDGAGDITDTARLEGPVETLDIVVQGLVETTDAAGVLAGLREKISPAAYLLSRKTTRPDKDILELGSEALASMGRAQVLDKAHALSAAVHGELDPDGKTEDDEVPVTAAEALAAGAGGPEAHAHLLISLALSNDIPARFVYGYAVTEAPGDDRDTLHVAPDNLLGWAELHVGKLGWVAFDALNACCPDDRYIRLCSGFDAADAAPIRTVASGSPDSDTTVDVVQAAMGQVQQ